MNTQNGLKEDITPTLNNLLQRTEKGNFFSSLYEASNIPKLKSNGTI
jgi:hypothetical protein